MFQNFTLEPPLFLNVFRDLAATAPRRPMLEHADVPFPATSQIRQSSSG
jgi:hypothetical protein